MRSSRDFIDAFFVNKLLNDHIQSIDGQDVLQLMISFNVGAYLPQVYTRNFLSFYNKVNNPMYRMLYFFNASEDKVFLLM